MRTCYLFLERFSLAAISSRCSSWYGKYFGHKMLIRFSRFRFMETEAVVAWHYDTRGMFSVRSAYRVRRAHERCSTKRRAASSSSLGNGMNTHMWKRL